MVFFGALTLFLVPGSIGSGIWLIGFAVLLGVAGELLKLAVIIGQVSKIGGVFFGLVSAVVIFFPLRWLSRRFVKALFE